MNTYFLMSPSLGATAIVEAPSTDKARTAFLDYLERTGAIPRTQRRSSRRSIATKRLTDSAGVIADIRIPYDYTWDQAPVPPQEALSYIAEESSPSLPEELPSPLPSSGPSQVGNMSPLARAALGI